jgi:hypothetical protein
VKQARLRTDTPTVIFRISQVNAGVYLAQIQVDGAESVLVVDKDPASPTFNHYISPQVAIP